MAHYLIQRMKSLEERRPFLSLMIIKNQAYRLAICTGRLDHDIVAINRKYHLGITERISQNGAVIYQGNQLNAVLLDKQAAIKIYEFTHRI